MWVYIKSNNLQNPLDKKEVLADDSLKDLFGKDKVTIPEVLLGAWHVLYESLECKSLAAQTDVAALFTGDEVSVSTHSQSPTCNQISYMFVVMTSVGVMSLSNIEILSHHKTSVAEPSCILPNFLNRNIFSCICFFHNV